VRCWADEAVKTMKAFVTACRKAALRPQLRYAAGGFAGRLTWLRRFAPAGQMDAGIRRHLRLDATLAVRSS